MTSNSELHRIAGRLREIARALPLDENAEVGSPEFEAVAALFDASDKVDAAHRLLPEQPSVYKTRGIRLAG